MQGQVETALPQIEARLAQVATWWQQHRFGQPAPEAPDTEFLARVFIGALNFAIEADHVLQGWASALRRLDAVLEVEHALGRPAEDIAVTRMNRANCLMRLERFGEARVELEDCLPLFQSDPDKSAKVLNSLADLFARQGDVAQAITQQRRVLVLCEQLPYPDNRAISHNNLANYLDCHGAPIDLAEAPRHRLAALIYRLVVNAGQALQTYLCKYAVDFHRAHAAGVELTVPRVAELLADPAFHPLEQWLRQRQVDVAKLQAFVDQILEQVRQAVLKQQ